MNAQEFMDKYYGDGEIFGEGVECVEDGDEIAEHKTVSQTAVYRLDSTNEYFEVTESRSNSGYWGDSERYDPECRKVKPVKKVIEVTEWEAV